MIHSNRTVTLAIDSIGQIILDYRFSDVQIIGVLLYLCKYVYNKGLTLRAKLDGQETALGPYRARHCLSALNSNPTSFIASTSNSFCAGVSSKHLPLPELWQIEMMSNTLPLISHWIRVATLEILVSNQQNMKTKVSFLLVQCLREPLSSESYYIHCLSHHVASLN